MELAFHCYADLRVGHRTRHKGRESSSRILRVDWNSRLMKQNNTLALDKTLLKKARALAAKQGSSVSAILAGN